MESASVFFALVSFLATLIAVAYFKGRNMRIRLTAKNYKGYVPSCFLKHHARLTNVTSILEHGLRKCFGACPDLFSKTSPLDNAISARHDGIFYVVLEEALANPNTYIYVEFDWLLRPVFSAGFVPAKYCCLRLTPGNVRKFVPEGNAVVHYAHKRNEASILMSGLRAMGHVLARLYTPDDETVPRDISARGARIMVPIISAVEDKRNVIFIQNVDGKLGIYAKFVAPEYCGDTA